MKEKRNASSWLNQHSHWTLVVLSTAIFLLFMVFVLPRESEKAFLATGSSLSPDTMGWYDGDMLYQLAEDYGPEGRAYYIQARFTFDLIWPLVYLSFLLFTIGWSLRPLSLPPRIKQLNLTPLYAFLFDLMENASVSIAMATHPTRTLFHDIAPYFSLTKWVFVGLSFVFLFVALTLRIIHAVRQRRTHFM